MNAGHLRASRAVPAISALATRLSFLVVAWLVLLGTGNGTWTVLAVAVQTLAYVLAWPLGARLADRSRPGRLSLVTDLLSTVALALVSFAYTSLVPLLVLVALVGAVRAANDRAHDRDSDRAREPQPSTADLDESAGAPPREWLIITSTLAGGAALGLVTALLGPAGGLWLIAMSCAICAVIAVWTGSVTTGVAAAESPVAAGDARELGQADVPEIAPPAPAGERALLGHAFARLWHDPVMRRVSVALFGVNVLVQAAAVLLLGVLQRDVLADDVAGFAAGAFVIGAVGAAVVLNAYAYQPARWAALALGYLAGGAALLVVGGMPATALLLLVALVVAGIALASVTPSAAMVVADRVPAALRGRASGLAASAAYLGIPLGTLAGAWVLPRTGIVLAITLASALYLVVTLVPLLILSAWREVMPEQPPPGTPSRSAEKLRARMSVTLAYADGQWLVEVRKGRALLGSRHAVNAADALRTLALLDVPTVYHGIGRVLSTDQDEAARQVARARNELASLEARLSGLQEMVDLSDNNKPT